MWGAMWGAPMILKVGCTQVLGPLRGTNLHECLALRVLGPTFRPSRSPSIPPPRSVACEAVAGPLGSSEPGRCEIKKSATSGSGRPLRGWPTTRRRATRRFIACCSPGTEKHRRTGPASYKGQFVPVRTFVLPSLPSRRSTRSCRTQHNQSSRISLRAPCRVFEAANAHMVKPLTSDL